MYVLSEDEYKEFKRFKESHSTPTPVKCHVCGRDYPNENILAHHMKSHVDGFQCNICSKVFKSETALAAHLKRHPPQAQPSKHSIFDSPTPGTVSLPVRKVKKHKHRSVLNFTAEKWLTLN